MGQSRHEFSYDKFINIINVLIQIYKILNQEIEQGSDGSS